MRTLNVLAGIVMLTLVGFASQLSQANPTIPLNSENPVPRGGQSTTLSIDQLPPEMQRFHEKDAIRPTRKSGQVFVEPAFNNSFAFIELMLATAQPIEKVHSKIGTQLSRFESSMLGPLTFKGYFLEGDRANSKRVVRLLSDLTGTVVALSEWDYVADGGGVLRIKEFVNAKVRDADAVLAARSLFGERTMWQLSWTTPKKDFILYVVRPAYNLEDKDLILQLAQSIDDSRTADY